MMDVERREIVGKVQTLTRYKPGVNTMTTEPDGEWLHRGDLLKALDEARDALKDSVELVELRAERDALKERVNELEGDFLIVSEQMKDLKRKCGKETP